MTPTSSSYLNRTCPGCENPADPLAPKIESTPPAETFPATDLQPYWNGFFKKKVFFTYTRCRHCGLLFAPVFFTPAQLETLYAQMPDNTAGLPIEALRRTQRGYYEFLKNGPITSGGYLELGPDIGLFTENAVVDPSFKAFWLFEPNRAVWQELSKKLSNVEHHICEEMLRFVAVPDGSVSVAVMIHVLDHLIDPAGTLQQLKQKLKPGALLLFVTHDESSLLAKMTGTRWPPHCLQHPQLYNPRSITASLERSGFRVMNISNTYNHFPLMYLAKHLLWILGAKAISLPMQDRFAISLKLGNIATLASFDA